MDTCGKVSRCKSLNSLFLLLCICLSFEARLQVSFTFYRSLLQVSCIGPFHGSDLRSLGLFSCPHACDKSRLFLRVLYVSFAISWSLSIHTCEKVPSCKSLYPLLLLWVPKWWFFVDLYIWFVWFVTPALHVTRLISISVFDWNARVMIFRWPIYMVRDSVVIRDMTHLCVWRDCECQSDAFPLTVR